MTNGNVETSNKPTQRCDMARPLKALIVDDSATTRKMIMKALGQTGLADFSFTEAEDGVDALNLYSPGETEIIFVDMNMPRMDGLEFVRELRSQYPMCPPTVMITGRTTSKTRINGAANLNTIVTIPWCRFSRLPTLPLQPAAYRFWSVQQTARHSRSQPGAAPAAAPDEQT